MIRNLILKMTHRIWNRVVSRILNRCYEDGYINSRQLHLIASKFDPTQQHEVY